ncbi:MAG: HlyD family efflux transporter periplasmic adaptor subunit [Gammaproteobacteria bacterium]|nr:HlyD family efflux transporter periplasmic adaptor subunit [Gammaproteobacteria bacterium]
MKKTSSLQWLEIICTSLPGTESAVFMVPHAQTGKLKSIARWPDSLTNLAEFAQVVKYTIKKKQRVCFPEAIKSEQGSFDLFSIPVTVQSTLIGILIVKIKHVPEQKQKSVFAFLKQSLRWMRLANPGQKIHDDFFSRVVSLLSCCFEQASYEQGLVSLVSELTQIFNCERVAFAEYHGHYSNVMALSNSASFDAHANLIQAVASAMDEAVEQDNIIVFPEENSKVIQRAHLELSRKFGTGSICSIPLINETKVFGTITLLRSEEHPFDKQTLMLLQQTFALITPYLALKREKQKHLILKIGSALKRQLQNLLGFRFLKFKLAMVLLAVVTTFASLIEGEFRVSANAILEGKIQRVITTPFAGYLLSASVRAGDTVRKGDIMASLNDSEINLQLEKLRGELQKIKREYRQAQSNRDLVNVRVFSEQINKAKAEIKLTEQQLDRINLSAPFDGVVIEGDLTQSLGSPVERGDALFKIAPLEGYRIILKVEEKDISFIDLFQPGILVLPSLSEQIFPLTVEKVTVASKAENGANIFRVEASLNGVNDRLRPGMQGVGKIYIGQERLIWIWTHEFVDWLRLWIWSWLP